VRVTGKFKKDKGNRVPFISEIRKAVRGDSARKKAAEDKRKTAMERGGGDFEKNLRI